MLASASQSEGIGRGSNRWLSPPGLAGFTIHLNLPVTTEEVSCDIPRLLTWIQHLASLAILQTLRELIEKHTVSMKLPIFVDPILFDCYIS